SLGNTRRQVRREAPEAVPRLVPRSCAQASGTGHRTLQGASWCGAQLENNGVATVRHDGETVVPWVISLASSDPATIPAQSRIQPAAACADRRTASGVRGGVAGPRARPTPVVRQADPVSTRGTTPAVLRALQSACALLVRATGERRPLFALAGWLCGISSCCIGSP